MEPVGIADEGDGVRPNDLRIQMPPAVLQRLLGVGAFAAERWAAGAVRTAYAAEVARRS